FLIQLVGTLLVIALLTIPPALALRLANGFFAVMATATAAGALMTLGGLAVSYSFDLPSGPAVVLLGAVLLLLVDVWQRIRQYTARRLE
ncbi:MAG TPA: metal ABC transporter permease, partial [Thermoanaerobaculia bacterium]|nr:metal ABC transporter permease [Thermoanaerobaculia bacterium]